jgi:hypothetical protein
VAATGRTGHGCHDESDTDKRRRAAGATDLGESKKISRDARMMPAMMAVSIPNKILAGSR